MKSFEKYAESNKLGQNLPGKTCCLLGGTHQFSDTYQG